MMPATANLQPAFPSLDDDILSTIAHHEQHNASFPMYVYRRDSDEDVTQVSFGQFIRAARRVPQLLVNIPIPSQSSGIVVAMIAQLDTLVYNAVELGLIICGLVPYLMSPRNTMAAIVHMLKSTDCHYILTTNRTVKELIDSVQSELSQSDPEYQLSIIEAPSFSVLFPELLGGHRPVDINTRGDSYSTFKAPKWEDVGLYLHSSGSTGLPKTIGKSHKQIRRAMAAFPLFSLFNEWSPRVRMLGVQLPPFHGMGSAVTLMLPLFYCTTVALFPPVVTHPLALPMAPTPDAIIDHIERSKSTCTLTIPGFLQAWAQDQRAVDILRKMDYVIFGGGGLSSDVGSILRSQGVRLYCAYGGTEIGGIASSSHREEDQEEWEYMEFSNITTPRWVPQGDGTYELQFLTTESHAPSVENLDDVRGYATSDLFKPHPTKPNLWKIVGRIDDVIVHSSGEKTVPAPMEAAITNSALVMAAVVFGQGFEQPGVLVEPTSEYTIEASDLAEVAKYRNLVWPAIEKANQLAPSFSRIFKEMILITDRTKPLPRAGKGTLLKKAAVNLYRSEIEALYATTASVDLSAQANPPKTWDHLGVSNWIFENVMDITDGKAVEQNRNFFEQGMDSLGATILRRRIASGLQTIQDDAGRRAVSLLTQTIIYNNPSVDSLSTRILELLGIGSSIKTPTHSDIIEQTISKYTFLDPVATSSRRKEDGVVVLITGSTGYFGSQVLEELLKDDRIDKIYTLNRPGTNVLSIQERHCRRFEEKRLDLGLLEASKLIHVETEYTKKNLGLDDITYAEISASVNVIIHVAWKVNFNLPLSSFEPNIIGTYNLVQLARQGGHPGDLKFIFISSVGVAQSWPGSTKGPYPDEIVTEAKYAVGKGYGESKYVIERILANSGINNISVRLGQITGGRQNNAWAISDWVPIMVKSSIGLGALPTAEGDITWIPTDTAARCILDLAFYDSRYPSAVNLVHHNPVGWDETIGNIKSALEEEKISLPLIPFHEWMERLGNVTQTPTTEVVEKIPAVLLYEFFEGCLQRYQESRPGQTEALGFPQFRTGEMALISKTFNESTPLSMEHARGWIQYWRITGLLD